MDSALKAQFLLNAVLHLPELSALIAAYEQTGIINGDGLQKLLFKYDADARHGKITTARAHYVQDEQDPLVDDKDAAWWHGYQHAMATVVQTTGKGGKGKGKGRQRGPGCWNCGELGHLQRNCPKLAQPVKVTTARARPQTDFRLAGR